jgi:hypothetical protein
MHYSALDKTHISSMVGFQDGGTRYNVAEIYCRHYDCYHNLLSSDAISMEIATTGK